MRLLLLVNPAASSVTPHVRAAVTGALAAQHDLDVVETSARNHAAALARDAARQGFDVVVVLAGDGTLNEAAQGLISTATALAPMPGGSTNVFARSLGVEFDAVDASAQLLDSLRSKTFRRIGVGIATTAAAGERGDGETVADEPGDGETAAGETVDRAFLFHLGIGFDAATVREMETNHAHMKRYLAHPTFALATAETWLHGYDRDTRVRVETTMPDSTGAAVGPYVIVSNAAPYTYVGRMPVSLAPQAGLGRALAVTVFRTLRLGVLASAALSGLGRARYVAASRDIAQFGDVSVAAITSDRPVPWQVDGDHIGSTVALTVRDEPEALSLVVPHAPRVRRRGRR